MQDNLIIRIDRSVLSILTVLVKVCAEAEQLKDQELAEDLWDAYHALKKIQQGIGPRGQTYRRL